MRRSTTSLRQLRSLVTSLRKRSLLFVFIGVAAVTCVDPVRVHTVASVEVVPPQLSLAVGSHSILVARVLDVSGLPVSDAKVDWSTGNAGIASVSVTGDVSAVSPGTVTITATSNSFTGTATVTVTAVAVPVASVSVAPTTANINVGQTTQLAATTRDASNNVLTGRGVTWSSSNTGIATVSSSGVVTGVGAGAATITATSEGKSGTSSVTVTALPAPVASVSVSPTTPSVSVGQTVQLTATAYDANNNVLTGRAVTWSSSNTGIATVSSSGVVTGVASGSATITATSEGKNGTASATVTPVPVASVSVSPGAPSVTVGQTVQLTATARDANNNVLTGRAVTWSSSNTGIATVSSSGVVTGVAAGSATITATSEGKSGTASVTVSAVPVASVSVSPATPSVTVGQTVQLTATAYDANNNVLTGRAVTWSSSNTGIATVSSSGVVTGVAAGSATITATSEGKSGTASATVTPVPVASVSVSPQTASVTVGQTTQLTATARDANNNVLTGRAVTWSSSNTGIATVSSSGVVTGVAAGSATITATSEGKSGTASLTITALPAPVASVSVSPATPSITVGQTVQLTATAYDASNNVLTGRVVTWSSSNTGIATVSSSGLVTGVATGSATITATSEGKNGTASVTVTPVPVASVSVAPATPSVTVGLTVQLTATTRDANNNVLTGRTVTWSSSNTGIATVSSSGVVTGVAAGSATITATSEGKSGTASVTVTPVPVATVSVSPATPSIIVGATVQLTATTRDANNNVLTGRTVTWSSSNTGIASVSSSGVVTGVGAGSATITATSEGKSGTTSVTVTPAPVATVTVAPSPASVGVGQTIQLTATMRDANNNVLTGRAVTWGSSNTGIATVSSSGVVTGVAVGSATITATSEGKSGTSSVSVSAASADPVLVGAGDIASCDSNGDEATANLLDNIAGTIFTAGDNVYDSGLASEFAACFDPTWGRHKARIRPAPGNHETYGTDDMAGYYGYFGAAAGEFGKGYYSYNLGAWHIVVINSNLDVSTGSAQETWLRADLAANPTACTLAYWHYPRFSSGDHGSDNSMQDIWQTLYDAGADVVVSGHDHDYERFGPQTPSGVADAARGIREFIVGTGGASHYAVGTPIANSQVSNEDTFGVLKFTLHATSYDWQFVPIAGSTFTDSGTGTCH